MTRYVTYLPTYLTLSLVPHPSPRLVFFWLTSKIQVATLISHKLNRKITHVNVSEAELARIMSTFMSEDYAKLLAKLDTAIKEGEEARLNGVVERVTGKKARDLRNFVDFCVAKDVWGKV